MKLNLRLTPYAWDKTKRTIGVTTSSIGNPKSWPAHIEIIGKTGKIFNFYYSTFPTDFDLTEAIYEPLEADCQVTKLVIKK